MEQRAEDVDMDPDACAKFFRREHFDWADEVAAGESDGEDSVIVVTENVRLSPSAQYASSLIEAFRQLQVANTLHKEAEAVRLSSHRPSSWITLLIPSLVIIRSLPSFRCTSWYGY